MTANSKAFILGLTGGIACGKSTVAARLAELGAIRVDADAITHELLGRKGAAVEKVRETFGEGALLPDGAVDRKRLGAIVFADAAARRALPARRGIFAGAAARTRRLFAPHKRGRRSPSVEGECGRR